MNLHKKSFIDTAVSVCTAVFLLSGFTVYAGSEEIPTELVPVINGIEKTMDLSSFHIDMEASINLNGKLINDTIQLYSKIDITQETSSNNLYMISESSSNLDDIITKSTYENGIYTVDDGKSVTETLKTPEEVLETVTSLTDLVKEAGTKIDPPTVNTTENMTVYEYELPAYLAKAYLKDLLKALDIEEIEGATIDVEYANLVSTLDTNGLLLSQTLHLDGTIHKAIFAIPASADMSAVFSDFQK